MRRLLRRAGKVCLILVATISMLYLPVQPAQAGIISLTINPKATLSAGSVTITGTLECTAGDTVDLFVQAIQGQGRLLANGAVSLPSITCTGAVQTWSATLTSVLSPFKAGPMSAVASAFDVTTSTFMRTAAKVIANP